MSASAVTVGDKESSTAGAQLPEDQGDYLTEYRAWLERFAAQVQPDDQLPVYVAGYRVTPAELRGEVLAWTSQYLASKRCPPALQTVLSRVVLQEVAPAAEAEPQHYGFDAQLTSYIPLRLMQAVIERVNAVCLRYLDNAQLDTLPSPPPHSDHYLLHSVSGTLKNSRRVMEDRHVEIPDLEALFGVQKVGDERTSVYGVYDGHVGGAAATYCAAHLHQYLVESTHFHTDLSCALRDAFLRTDAEYVAKRNEKRANGGSTAVVVVVRGKTLLAGWVGDSQALLVKRYTYLPLVYPHRPDREDERERIQALGGQVMFWGTWRVNGQLAVSRAIGDAHYKPYVSGEPELTAVGLEGDEDFVVIASDGLWDVLSEEGVMLLVYCELLNHRDDLKAVPQRLILRAKREGSGDNISVIVVFLREPRLICRDFVRMGPSVLPESCSNGGMSAEEAAARDWDAELAAQAQPDAAHVARLLAAGIRCEEGKESEGEEEEESDSEDLGPETAVDGAEDAEADAEIQRLQTDTSCEPAPPRTDTTPTPPVHATGASSAQAENVAESGEESEDEWNYFKGEQKERADSSSPQLRRVDLSPQPAHADIDRGAWEEEDSSDMNSSPLNPDAPVFVPGGADSPLLGDRLLAESPRKPLPMDDMELPDDKQFASEATERPADLLDIRDILNGHHSISLEDKTERDGVNGDNKRQLQSELLQDIARVQRDTTDFCNIQVGFAQTGDVDLVSGDVDEALFEKLKSKESDPMSMSFYREKDSDDTEPVDLNVVRRLPDSDEEPDVPSHLPDKENFPPAHTDTPESHKLLFEQIPEMPHGKNRGWASGDQSEERTPSSDASAAALALPDFLAAPGRDLDMDLLDDYEASAPPLHDDFNSFTGHNPFTVDRSEAPTGLFHDITSVTKAEEHNLAEDTQHDRNGFTEELIPETRQEPQTELNFTLDESKPEPEPSHDDFVNDSASCDIQTQQEAGHKTGMQLFDSDEPYQVPSALTPEPSTELLAPSPHPTALSPDLASSPQRVAFSPEPTAASPQPAFSPAPPTLSPVPVAFSPEHRTLSPNPPARSPSPVVLSPEPEAERSPQLEAFTAEPITKSPEPAISPELVAPSPIPVALSPDPPAQSPIPVALSPEPMALSPEPTALSPEPAALSPEPTAFSMEPAVLSPEPLALSLEPVEQIIEPTAPSPIPVASSPELLAPSPVPVAVSPELRIPSPQPVQSPEPEHKLQDTESIQPVHTEPTRAVSPVPSESTEVPSEPLLEVKAAQEICVSVTEEIPSEVQQKVTTTPPPTPAVDSVLPTLDVFSSYTDTPLVQETMLATDTPVAAAPIQPEDTVAAVAGAAAIAVAATAAVAAATKTKTPSTTKKPTTTTKTPVSPTKPAAKTPLTKTTPAVKKTPTPATPRTPASAAKPTPPKLSAAKAPATKAASPAMKPTATTARTPTTKTMAAAKPAPTLAAAKPAAAKPAVTKSAPVSARPAPTKTVAVPKPAPARVPAARPSATAAPKPKPAAPKAAETKPLTNGDVRPPIRRPVPGAVPPPKPAATAAAPKPAPRPALAARPAPRTTAPTQTKTAAPKPAARAPTTAPRPSDKLSKDTSNKRLSAGTKTAPPRTTSNAPKSVSKPSAKPVAGGKEAEPAAAKVNGSHEPAPATQDAAEGALLPDLVA